MATAAKTGLDALKTISKNEVHKAGEATGKIIGNKIADKILNPKPLPAENSKKCWRNNYSTRKERHIKWITSVIVVKGKITV